MSPLSRLIRIGFVTAVLAIAFLVATAVLFIWPTTDVPGHADAVVVLSGGLNRRLDPALRLMREGVAPLLVISGSGYDPSWKKARRLCAHGARGFRILCFDPKPYATRGEAEEIGRLARSRGWHRVVVVTSGYHVSRARMLVQRCYHRQLAMVGVGYAASYAAYDYLTEWAKLLYQLTVHRSC